MSAQSHFEKLIDAEMEKLLQASIRSPAGDSHAHATLQGRYQGLDQAKKLYREAARIDIEQDDV